MFRSIARPLATLVVIALVAPAGFAQSPQSADPFAVLDARFGVEVSKARKATLSRTGPVVLVLERERVVLVRGRQRTEESFEPAGESVLRTLNRVPFAIHSALISIGPGELDPVRHSELSQFQKLIFDAQRSLVGKGFPQPVLDRQQNILAESARLLEDVVDERKVDRAKVAQFARAMAPLVRANVDEMAKAQLDKLHTIVSRWKAEIPAAEFEKIRVLVLGGTLSREGEVVSGYFTRLLGPHPEGRVVHAEGVTEEQAALDYLAGSTLDRATGSAFFGTESENQREILGAAARTYLEVLKPEAPPPPVVIEPTTGKKKKKKPKKAQTKDQN